MPGTLSIFHVLTDLKFIIVLWGRNCAHPHVTDQETDRTVKQLVQVSEPSQDSNQAGQFQSPHRASALCIYLGLGMGRRKGREEKRKKTKQNILEDSPPLQHTHS